MTDTEQKTELTDAEVEELISSDPTPKVAYKTSAKLRKRAAAYMRDYRDGRGKNAEEKVEPTTQEPFETGLSLKSQLYNCLYLAKLLGRPQPWNGETYSQFFSRIFSQWEMAGYPLLKNDGQDITLDKARTIGPGLVLPIGSDNPIPPPHEWPLPFGVLGKIALLEAQSDAVGRARDRRLARADEHWVWNPALQLMVPVTQFERNKNTELADYHRGFQYVAKPGMDHPVMERRPGWAEVCSRMTLDDLREIIRQDFEHAVEKIERRNL